MSPRTDAIMSAPIVIQDGVQVVTLQEMGIEQNVQLLSDPMLAQRPTQQIVVAPQLADQEQARVQKSPIVPSSVRVPNNWSQVKP